MCIKMIGRRFIGWWTPPRLALALLVLAILIGALGYLNEVGWRYLADSPRRIIAEFYANFTTELVSVAFTILVVDRLYQRREKEREKKRLILQMGSPDNAFAREAARALQSSGWLRDGSLKGAWLMGANLQGAFLWGANLQGAWLEDVKLQETNLAGANLQEAVLVAANLQQANLQGANLQEAVLVAVNLQEANLRGANLQEANLAGAKLQEAVLVAANLQGAYLVNANLQEAILWGANLQGANLGFADLQGAKYNNATTWSEGFTPPPEAINADAGGLLY
jgi:hypothetical protein